MRVVMVEQPLKGVVVLDFGQVYNGPYCGFLLAQAGARVIKVEAPRGETLRARGRNAPSAYPFALLNSNKEGITLNIKHPEGQALLKRMVAHVDVVMENFAPGTMARYGIGADVLREINPRLIYASSTGYGDGGPYRDYRGMDVTLQAMAGVMSVTGEGDGPPMKTAATLADMLGGAHMYAGIVSALFGRERSGEGARVDISMQDCVFPTLATALGSFYVQGSLPERQGNRHPGRALAPYNVYEAADGHVAIICIREGHWRGLCAAMNDEALADEPRFATMAARCEHMSALDEQITAWTRTQTKARILELGQAHGVVCAPVKTLDEVVEDPHLHARGTLETRQHPDLGDIAQMHSPLRFEGVAPTPITDPPSLGGDNDAVYAALAELDAGELQRLRDVEAL